MSHWTVTVEEDKETGDLVLPLPADLLNQMGWDPGTLLEWEEVEGSSSYILKKVEEDGNNGTTSCVSQA